MITEQECENLAKQKLSEKRFLHTLGVKEMALRLAALYGADQKKAAVAALLHDIVKEEPKDACLQLLRQGGIIQTISAPLPDAVLHAPAAAVYAREKLGVTDPEILSAIASHTTGRVGMSLLDKIIFIADATSAERSYPGVENLRALALGKKLDEAVIASLQGTLDFVRRRGGVLDETSQKTLDDLKQSISEG